VKIEMLRWLEKSTAAVSRSSVCFDREYRSKLRSFGIKFGLYRPKGPIELVLFGALATLKASPTRSSQLINPSNVAAFFVIEVS
jgi:hypothetical protein